MSTPRRPLFKSPEADVYERLQDARAAMINAAAAFERGDFDQQTEALDVLDAQLEGLSASERGEALRRVPGLLDYARNRRRV